LGRSPMAFGTLLGAATWAWPVDEVSAIRARATEDRISLRVVADMAGPPDATLPKTL
jgi:hypothetical protein